MRFATHLNQLLPQNFTLFFLFSSTVPRERRWRHLRRAEPPARPRLRGVSGGGHAHVPREGVPARQRVLRLHRGPPLKHGRTGVPAVRLRPLAGHARLAVDGR